jgi:hypothetical protein
VGDPAEVVEDLAGDLGDVLEIEVLLVRIADQGLVQVVDELAAALGDLAGEEAAQGELAAAGAIDLGGVFDPLARREAVIVTKAGDADRATEMEEEGRSAHSGDCSPLRRRNRSMYPYRRVNVLLFQAAGIPPPVLPLPRPLARPPQQSVASGPPSVG